MPDVVEPGTRLVQRYRLEEHLGGPGHALGGDESTNYWRAHDELLDRPVGVCLIAASDGRAQQVLRAAREAAALTDSRFLRVLDASEVDGVVYVVSEWVRATSLVDLVADGPLPPHEARALGLEISAALAAAHAAGLAHLCLQPGHVLRTAHGQVKLAGLGVDAAAAERSLDDESAAAADTRGAAAVLYAALTGRWPGDGDTGLAPAPHDGAALCSPRQVRAGVPDDLDDVVCRALAVPGRHGGAPLRSPAELVSALTAAHVTSRIPVVGAVVAHTPDRPPPSAPYDDQGARGGRPRAAAFAWSVAGLVLVVGLALFGGQLVMTALDGGESAADQTGDGGSTSSSSPGPTEPLEVAEATTFDPPPGDGEENSDRAARSVDGDPATAWPTKTYFDPFGPTGLKDGVGLLLDLGKARDVAKVAITVQGGATDLELRVAERRGSALDDYEVVEQAANVDGRTVLRPDEPARARYVLVWLTAVPLREDGYRGEIADVTISG
ncbi:MAG TPA: protein kinase family protein [Actinomycetes bacterium]